MINKKNGEIIISNKLTIYPQYTFEDFKTTCYYKNQDGIRVIYLDEPQIICGRKYMVELFFRNKIIYMVILVCCDVTISECDEPKRKAVHDSILKKLGIMEGQKYTWGKITSEYDARSNISSINILYY